MKRYRMVADPGRCLMPKDGSLRMGARRDANFIALSAYADGVQIVRLGAGADQKHLRFVKY